MSVAGNLPYHLRQNKAIDRNLFVDLLQRVGRYRNISDFQYVGFGGPYLEDHKLMHGALRLRQLVSLEKRGEVVKRQRFNQPVSGMTLHEMTSGDYLTKFDFEQPSIVWFDYTEPKSLGLQLGEIELLVRKLNAGDVFKITLNAAPEALGRPTDPSTDLLDFRLERFRERAGSYCPSAVDADSVTTANYPKNLLKAIESAAKHGLDTKPRCVLMPLTAFVYADGQQMLTATAIVLEKVDLDKFGAESRLGSWPFHSRDWADLRSISVPQLSIKERILVESLLPDETDVEAVFASLGFEIGPTPDEARLQMQNFMHYYRLYPWYSRVVL
jgi:hypothetical protein